MFFRYRFLFDFDTILIKSEPKIDQKSFQNRCPKRFSGILKNLQIHCKVSQKSRFGESEFDGKMSSEGSKKCAQRRAAKKTIICGFWGPFLLHFGAPASKKTLQKK